MFLATDEESLVRAAALVELWASGFVEPVEPPPETYHVLAQKPAEDLALMTGWRRAALGEPLLELLLGKRTVSLNWNDGSLRTMA